MEEINIERKKRPVWPWILLLIILALLAWAIYEMTNDRDEYETDETVMVIPAQMTPPLAYQPTA